MQSWQRPEARKKLIAWARGLAKRWDWFVTLTFRNATQSEETAVRRLRSFLSSSARTHDAPSSLLWSAHHHASGNVHLHALWEGSSGGVNAHCKGCRRSSSSRDPDWKRLKEAWHYHYGIARFLPYDEALGGGAVGYVLRYVLKEECTDWDFWQKGVDYRGNS